VNVCLGFSEGVFDHARERQNVFLLQFPPKLTDKILLRKEHHFTPIPIRPLIFTFGLPQFKFEPEP